MLSIERAHAPDQIVFIHTYATYVKRAVIQPPSATAGPLRAEAIAGAEVFIPQHLSPHHSAEAHLSTSGEQDNLALEEVTASLFNKLDPAQLSTPINAQRLNRLLKSINYPIKSRLFLFSGFVRGFRLGFHGTPNSDCNVNNRVLNQIERQAIKDTITKELSKRRIRGPFAELPYQTFQLNPISAIPKKNGKYRMISNLSSPAGKSINDGISDDFARVSYASLDSAINLIIRAGPNAFMSKSDIESAFRLLPIASDDQHLLCFKFDDQFYVDKCLPMGARSSCALFEAFSSSLEYILHQQGFCSSCHYLDDYLFVGSSYKDCENHLLAFKSLCEYLNVPLAKDKTFGPSRQLEFLGFLIDTVEQSVKLPSDKLDKGIEALTSFLNREKCTLKELQALLGFLNFTCTVVIPGRAFLCRLYGLLNKASRPYHKIRLSISVKRDLQTWLTFLLQFNGKSLYRDQRFMSNNAVEIYSDASGSHGFAAVLGRLWFAGSWPSTWWMAQNIFFLELVPVFLALFLWADTLSNKTVILRVDNEALVHVINSQTSKDTKVMFIIRELVLLCLCRNIQVKAVHIRGVDNKLADALSRAKFDEFFDLFPDAIERPVPIPVLPHTVDFKTQSNFSTQMH